MLSDSLKLFSKLFLVILVIFSIVTYILAILLGPVLFYFTSEGFQTSIINISTLPLRLMNFSMRIPIGLSIGVIFFIIWVFKN